MFGLRIDPSDEAAGLRPALLRTLTELYVQKPSHTQDEERHFTELALRLIDVVDMPEREDVADRLIAYGRAPQAVMSRLASRLNPYRDTPVEPYREAPVEIVEAAAVAPSGPASDPAPAQADELCELFFGADASERRLILQMLDYAPIEPAAALHAVHARDAARRLEIAALSRSPHEFAVILVGTLGIAQPLAARIVTDPSGEALIAILRAIDMPAAIVQRVLLFLNPAIGEAVHRVYDLAQLYEELAPENARRLLSVWRMAGPARAARHQPLHYDDERHHPRAEAATARSTGRTPSDRARNAG
jgi:hypothetical protein